ncbi:MAG: histidine kinase dimerization/phospho-acceptor domain-containing protein [Clostridia bacterium]
MKNTLLTKILGIVICTVILSATITMFVFSNVGKEAFVNIKADELLPRAQYLATISAQFLLGRLSKTEYERVLGSNANIWDATFYATKATGEFVVTPNYNDTRASHSLIEKYSGGVLNGETIVKENELFIGVPIKDDYGNVLGAAYLVKPLNEVIAAVNNINVALILSLGIAMFIMLVPVYLVSLSLTRPIKTMTVTASAMAKGDFGVRAKIKGNDEIATLGMTLNFLAGELKLTIDELTMERNRLKQIVDGMGEGLIAAGAGLNILTFNPAAKKMLEEYTDIDESDERFVPIGESIQRVLNTGEPDIINIITNERTLKFTTTAIDEGITRAVGTVTLIQDVTEAVRFEQARRDYVANVSHELRTPIASIRLLADALNDGMVKTEDDRVRYYGYILRESMRLSRLIDDLLELSRLQSKNIALNKRRIDTMDLLNEIFARESDISAESDMKLILDVTSCSDTYSNSDRIEQVLITLIDNAVKHSDCEAEIIISAKETEKKVILSVENPGNIAKGDINHLFERFYKSDKAHVGNGTGLGLAIAQEIMTFLNEEIWVKNEDGRVIFSFTIEKAEE